MFAKELRDTLRQVLQALPFFAVVPALYLLDVNGVSESMSFLEFISIGSIFTVYSLAFYLAYNMFQAEDHDGATEYLLSLPLRGRILFLSKVGPRIMVLIPLKLAAQLLTAVGSSRMNSASGMLSGEAWLSLPDLLFLLLTVLCGFIVGVIGRKSWLTIAVLSLVLFGSIHTGLAGVFSALLIPDWIDIRSMSAETVGEYINASILLGRAGWILTPVMLLGAFLPAYRKWSPSTRRAMELSFAKRASVLVVLLLVPAMNLLVRS